MSVWAPLLVGVTSPGLGSRSSSAFRACSALSPNSTAMVVLGSSVDAASTSLAASSLRTREALTGSSPTSHLDTSRTSMPHLGSSLCISSL